MDKEHYKTLAQLILSKYDGSVHICINPYYWLDNGSICGLGDFKPNDVDKLANLLEEVSNQIFEETGDYITGVDWVHIFPEDDSSVGRKLVEIQTVPNSVLRK